MAQQWKKEMTLFSFFSVFQRLVEKAQCSE